MLVRKYCAFVSSTFPWVWGCCLTWWVDRLLVEMGHRTTSAPLCNHSQLQYVSMHCYAATIAVVGQSIHSFVGRQKQFHRETILLGIRQPCIIHLGLFQIGICTLWSIVVACLIDVSPWLCYDFILEHRATIALVAIKMVLVLVVIEQKLYEWTLKRAVMVETFEI
jgi:hypothetical protein